MYRLTIFYLGGLVVLAVIMSAFGWLAFNPLDILITTTEVLGGTLLANQIMADWTKANINIESTIITALILALIITPKFPVSFVPIAIAGAFAIGSKFWATIMDHHVFNPAAAGIVALALLSDVSATWWVGTPVMLPFVIIGGYLVVKKVNREKMVGQFLLVFLASIGIVSLSRTGSLGAVVNTWYMSISHTALLFFAAVMFTEPATSPGTEQKRGYFAILTALLYATPQLNISRIVFTPEIALVLANAFSFMINPQYRFVLKLKLKRLIARDTYEFVFETPGDLQYQAGQYMEWTLPHEQMDDRGNRRYFSLSSIPSEDPAFAIKYYEPPSSYKKNLLMMSVGSTLSATNLAGDFMLPKGEIDKPLVFIAGGIGIAPFRSMIKKIVVEQKQVKIILLYINKNGEEVAYGDLWQSAMAYGVQTKLIMTAVSGHLNPEMIRSLIPNYMQYKYYISGPQRLVEGAEQVLDQLSLPKSQIVTDFFPGY